MAPLRKLNVPLRRLCHSYESKTEKFTEAGYAAHTEHSALRRLRGTSSVREREASHRRTANSCSRLPGRKEVALSRAEDNASSIREVVPEPQRGRVGRKPARSDPSPGFQPTTGSLGQKWPQFGFPARNRWFGLEEGEPTAAAPSPWSSTVRCLVTMK